MLIDNSDEWEEWMDTMYYAVEASLSIGLYDVAQTLVYVFGSEVEQAFHAGAWGQEQRGDEELIRENLDYFAENFEEGHPYLSLPHSRGM
jgi:hypothetical protein